MIRNLASLLFAGGLLFFLMILVGGFDLGQAPMLIGQGVQASAQAEVGAANFVTSVVLAYRGFDTLGELSILFAAAAAAGLVLGKAKRSEVTEPEGGFVLRTGADLLFPLLMMVGFYIIVHGHLTPGGGFQGGVILAAAFFIPLLARPSGKVNHVAISFVEGIAGATFIGIGLIALFQGHAFLQPMLNHGQFGTLLSAGTLPFLYMAVGLKVGAELAGLLAHIADADEEQA